MNADEWKQRLYMMVSSDGLIAVAHQTVGPVLQLTFDDEDLRAYIEPFLLRFHAQSDDDFSPACVRVSWLDSAYLEQLQKVVIKPRRVTSDGLGVFIGGIVGDIPVVLQEGVGFLAVFPDGRLLVLVVPPVIVQGSMELRNPGGLVQVLSTEVLARDGFFVVHAGGVVRTGGAQLWSGLSGYGKTTQVLKLMENGWKLLGDDQVVIRRHAGGHWEIWPIVRHLAVTPDAMRRCENLFAGYERKASARGKCSIDPSPWLADVRQAPWRVSAIHFLNPSNAISSGALSAVEAVPLMGDGFFYYVSSGSAGMMLERVLDLCTTVPVFQVTRGYLNAAGPTLKPYWEMLD